ncbi:MAG: NfeD family protein [Caldisericaceae bacterium]
MKEITNTWIIIAVISLIVEVITPTFFAIWFSVAAIITLIFNFLEVSLPVQVAIFILTSLVLILASEFILKRKLNLIKKPYKTNVESIIGKIGFVTKEVGDLNHDGEVFIYGKYWTAISEDGKTIPVNKKVIVVRIDGVKLIVKEVEE